MKQCRDYRRYAWMKIRIKYEQVRLSCVLCTCPKQLRRWCESERAHNETT